MTGTILATGGAGYIGSHVVLELIRSGYRVVILDNFENSDISVVDRIQQLTRVEIDCIQGDVADGNSVARILRHFAVDAVVHLAGKKAVAESVTDPLLYFNANLNGAMGLLRAMDSVGVSRLVFSSSATVYGVPESLPIGETAATGVTNPYGRTKLMIEEMIEDYCAATPEFGAISLRYFNPVGAHDSGMIGEDPKGIPNNLFPIVARTAAGLRPAVQVFGSDFDTPDGTGVRDFIHVVDLAHGHLAAIEYLFRDKSRKHGHQKINLGTGIGYSVLEVIRAFSQACGDNIPYEMAARRPGDVAASVADPTLAKDILNWSAVRGLAKMCRDHWRFQKMAEQRDHLSLRLAELEPRTVPLVERARTNLEVGH